MDLSQLNVSRENIESLLHDCAETLDEMLRVYPLRVNVSSLHNEINIHPVYITKSCDLCAAASHIRDFAKTSLKQISGLVFVGAKQDKMTQKEAEARTENDVQVVEWVNILLRADFLLGRANSYRSGVEAKGYSLQSLAKFAIAEGGAAVGGDATRQFRERREAEAQEVLGNE